MSTDNWASLREAGFVSGMRLLFWVYRYVGAWAFHVIIYPVIAYYFLFNGRARRASREFLTKALGHTPSYMMSYRHLLAFAHSAIDKLGVWAGERVLKDYEYHGREHLLAQIAKREGGVLLGAHLGNMEICRNLARLTPGLKLKILVHTTHAKMFNRLLSEVEEARDMELIEVGQLSPATAVYLADCVKRGEFVAILADRVSATSRQHEQIVNFFGAPAPFPEGPFILASLLKCPVFTLFSVRDKGRYVVTCEPFTSRIVLPRKRRDEALREYISQFAMLLEEKARLNPLQWFNFYPFWSNTEEVQHDPTTP